MYYLIASVLFAMVLWFVFKVLKSRDHQSDSAMKQKSRDRLKDMETKDVRHEIHRFYEDPEDHFVYTRMRKPTASDVFRDLVAAFYFLFLNDDKDISQTIKESLSKHAGTFVVLMKEDKGKEYPLELMVLKVIQQLELHFNDDPATEALQKVKIGKEWPSDPLNVLDTGVRLHVQDCVRQLLATYRSTFLNDTLREGFYRDMKSLAENLPHKKHTLGALQLIRTNPVTWDETVTDFEILCLLWVWTDEPRHFALGPLMKQQLLKTMEQGCVKDSNEWRWGVQCRVTHLVCCLSGFAAKDDEHMLGRGPCPLIGTN